MKNWRALILPLLLTGCATSPRSAPETEKSVSLSAKIEASRPEYLQSMAWMSPRDVNKKVCVPPKDGAFSPHWKAWIENVNACVQQKSWDHVEAWGSQFMQGAPNSPWGSYYLALSAEARESYPRALWMIELTLKKAPHVGAFYLEKSRILWETKSYREAVSALQGGIKADPTFTFNHEFLAQIYYRDRDFDQAATLFGQVLAVNPEDEIAIGGLAECQIQQGHHQAAVLTYEQGLGHYPKNTEWRLRQAYAYDELLKKTGRAPADETKSLVGGKR